MAGISASACSPPPENRRWSYVQLRLGEAGRKCGSDNMSGFVWVVPVLCWLSYALLQRFRWAPASLVRLLRSRGFTVLPYTPFVGDLLHISRLQRAAYSSPLASPSNHRYLSRIWPFHFATCPSPSGKSPIFWHGQQPTLHVVSAEYAREILSSDNKSYVKFPSANIAVKRVLGHSLLTTNGREWEIRRRILNPAFSSDKLKAKCADMSLCVKDMVDSWTCQAQQKGGELELDVHQECLKVSADMISRTSFGSNYKEGKAIFKDQEVLMQATYRDGARHTLIPGYRFLPTPTNVDCWRRQKRIEKTLQGIIVRRMGAVRDGQATSYGEDLLGHILAANSSTLASEFALTERDIMDECRTFFFAGHETTANLLTWAMMLMAVYPDWQERARAEVLEMHGSEGLVNPRGKFKILEMILLETLRLYPPIPQLFPRRKVKEGANDQVMDARAPQKVCVPLGVRLTLLPGVIHRDQELWGKDADDFRPERFADGIAGACRAAHGFMAFGFGPHICIGQTFAMLEAKLVLASVLQGFRFRLSDLYQHAPHLSATLRPQFGMPLLMTTIQASS